MKNKQKPNQKQSKRQRKLKKLEEKQRMQKEEEDGEQQNDADDLGFDEKDEEQVDVSFAISEINQKHYHSLKTILERFAQFTSTTSSEWASLIIENKSTGNVAVADDEEDEESENEDNQSSEQKNQEPDDEQDVCSGVLSLVCANNKKLKTIIKKIAASGEKNGKKLGQIDKSIHSILINERAVNLPAFVVQNMHEVFIGDMLNLQKEDNEAFKKVCSGYIFVVSWVERNKSDKIDDLIFSKFQDYEMIQRSEHWWIGENIGNSYNKGDLRKLYYVMKWESYVEGVRNIKSLLE